MVVIFRYNDRENAARQAQMEEEEARIAVADIEAVIEAANRERVERMKNCRSG